MPTRLTLFIAATIAIACSLVWPPSALAQVDRVADPTWTTPRTADGQPDLQGLWGNKTITPTERPDSAGGRAFLTDEEMAAASRQRIAALEAQDEAPARRTEAGGGIGAYGSYWLDSGDTVLSTGQTSLIVDPPDGRTPIKAWALETKAYNLAHEGDHYRHLSTLDRCLSRGVPGSMLPAGYNNTHRIAQTPDHVVIQHEMIHDLRIIPLSDHAHVDDRIGLWMGDARARWDGEVLVVETRNFHNRGWIATSFAGGRLKGIPTSSALHVVERYERVSETTIMLTVTVDDPNVYTRPWTISMPLTAEPDYVIYEYACHEGNYAIPNILAGARKADAVAAQDDARDYPQWRGRARDGSASAFVAPARWPETLTWRWATDVGEGYATPLVVGETVYTFTRQNDDEVATALDATTGDVVWRTAYPAPYEMFSGTAHHGAGPKATPLFHDGRLYTHGISGAVSAFDGATGDIVWQIPAPDIQPLFGTAISPLADGDRVIVHPGYAPLTALDARTGNVVWATGDQGVWASPIITQLDGVRQVVSVAYQVIEGVGLTDGAVLWQYPIDPEMVHAVTPLAYDGMVLLSGQDSGVKALRPLRRDGTWEVELAWEAPEVSMDLSNPVLIGDALFGLSHRSSGQYFVIDARTGDVEWLGEPRAAQNTAVVKADDLLFLLNDDAELIVGRIGRAGLERIRGYTVADSATWAQPAISGNRLFIKDIDTVALWTVD